MADELRPDVIGALARARGLDTAQGDALLDATPAERAAASRLLLERARELLQQAGALPPSRSVLDVGYGQLQALAAVFVVADRWWPQPGLTDRSLGDLCKVIPAADAEQIMRILRWAGFLPPEPPAQPGGG